MGTLTPSVIELAGDFAMRMTYLGEGQHKATRSGGLHKRNQREIFSDTFQGKLAEFALLQILSPYLDKTYLAPSLLAAPLGYWEASDVLGPGISIEVKSTKPFGNLLLLEKENWNSSGEYRHGTDGSATRISHVALIRISPSIHEHARMLEQKYMTGKADKVGLTNELLRHKWTFDIAGFARREDLQQVFRAQQLLRQGSMLGPNGVRMDADNYYIQTGDLRPLSELLPVIHRAAVAASNAQRKEELVSQSGAPASADEPESGGPMVTGAGDEGQAKECQYCSSEVTDFCSCGHAVNCEIECNTNVQGIHSRRSFKSPSFEAPPESASESRRGTRWLRSEDEKLIELFTEGLSFTELAQTLKRSRGSISSRVNKLYLEDQGYMLRELGDTREKVTKPTATKVLALYLQGTPVEDISTTLGLQVATVAKELMMARVLSPVSLDEVTYYPEPQGGGLWTTKEDTLLLELFHSGQTLKAMAENLSRSRWALLYRLFRLDQISEDNTEEFVKLIRAGR